ncbi:MAG: helix-turn-helix domain-containing protein [Myxococcota bacterium]|nr:helix-turn-helix domain-containing protein [Myxococcales bacterium]
MAGAATVEKALDVLFHLHAAGEALGPSEIGRALDLPKSSCHRLLAALAQREVVERDALGRYRPGVALLALGLGAQHRDPIVRAARPTLEAEAAAFGETVFLVARRGGRLRVLDKVEGMGFLRAAPGLGDEIPEDVTAAGQLHRAWEPPPAPDDRSATLPGPAWAVNRDAWIAGLSVLGVPVFEARPGGPPRIAGVLALAAASARFDAIGEDAIATRLCFAARQVNERLGVTGSLGSRTT